MPGVSVFDWFMVFGIPMGMCLAFIYWALAYATNGEDK